MFSSVTTDFGSWTKLENSVNQAVNWYLFRIRKRQGSEKERDGLNLSSAVPKIQEASTSYWAIRNFYLFSSDAV